MLVNIRYNGGVGDTYTLLYGNKSVLFYAGREKKIPLELYQKIKSRRNSKGDLIFLFEKMVRNKKEGIAAEQASSSSGGSKSSISSGWEQPSLPVC